METTLDMTIDYYKIVLADMIKRGKITLDEIERKLKGGKNEHTRTS